LPGQRRSITSKDCLANNCITANNRIAALLGQCRAVIAVDRLAAVNGLAAMKGKPLAFEALDLWWMSMQKWSLADFKSAAAHLVSSANAGAGMTQQRYRAELTEATDRLSGWAQAFEELGTAQRF
jgi:hypothetical protein